MKSTKSFSLHGFFPLTLFFIVFCAATIIEGTSLMRRIRDRQSSDVDDKKGLDFEVQDWINVPQPIQDVLMSIDDKLRSLDTFSYTLKLARLDFSLDQLVRRMENIETKFGRLDTKFDVRMEKIEEIVISKDIKEEFTNEHLSRRMENLNEKINNKAAYLDAKLDMKLEKILSRLELIERELHNSADDILERLIKNEERFSTLESEMFTRKVKNEELSNTVADLSSFIKGNAINMIVNKSQELSIQLGDFHNSFKASSNQTHGMLTEIHRTLTAKEVTAIALETERNNSNFTKISEPQKDFKTFYADNQMAIIQEQINNLTSICNRSLQIGDTKLNKINSDIELYTRKVVNGLQELEKTSDKLETDISKTLEQGHVTQQIIQQEHDRFKEHSAALSRVESKFLKLSEIFDKKMSAMENNFATLLMSQNSFIASCHRIQEEETHVYDILQQIIYEMRNRSVEDVRTIKQELHLQGSTMNDSLIQIVATVSEIKNSTNSMTEIYRQYQQFANGGNELKTNDVPCKLIMESLCKDVFFRQKKTSETLVELEDDFAKKLSHVTEQQHIREQTSESKLDAGLHNKNYDFLDYPMDNESDYSE